MTPTTPRENETRQPLTVFYDGSCPVCRREISVYQRGEGGDGVAWVDAASTTCPLPQDLSRDRALARFHVRDGDGRMLSGAAAFAALWWTLPRWRWLGVLISLPIISGLAEGAYRNFLAIRPRIQQLFR